MTTVINGTINSDYLSGTFDSDEVFANAGNDTVWANEGNDTVHGGTGNDGLRGENGNDALYGDEGDDSLYGGAGSDTLIGGDGNDMLYAGRDYYYYDNETVTNTLQGGQGNDVYFLVNPKDIVIEAVNEGIDTVNSMFDYTLGANIENLQLTDYSYNPSQSKIGMGNELNNVISGNSQNNSLYGYDGNDTLRGGDGNDSLMGGKGNDLLSGGSNAQFNNYDNDSIGNDTLFGGEGNDTLDGGSGIDSLVGGNGDDTYYINSAADIIVESGETAATGIDTVMFINNVYGSAAITYTLAQNVENLTYSNNYDYYYGLSTILSGNNLNNHIIGGSSNDAINGGIGNDNLEGGLGNDTLDGGEWGDTMAGGSGSDTYYVDSAKDVIIENGDDYSIDLVIVNYVSYTLGNYLENLTLAGTWGIGGTGNSLNNMLTGNTGANYLSAGAGNDTLSGDAGNDTLIAGTGNDTLDGGVGADTLQGELGDDSYVVDNAGDKIVELKDQGYDKVSSSVDYVLTANVEDLTLTGSTAVTATGNSLNNMLTGNSLNNRLMGNAGDDQLDGGIGQDTLEGGLGNDSYIVNDVGDVIIELANQGNDIVVSMVDYTLAANFENLTLGFGSAALTGKGNSAQNWLLGNEKNNTLYGYEGDDYLSGGQGNDSLIGGVGNDRYRVDSSSDVVVELGSEGNDTVESTISYTLGDNIENLDFSNSYDYYNFNPIIGQGNALDNLIVGSNYADKLSGLAGNDTLMSTNDISYYNPYYFSSPIFGFPTFPSTSRDTLMGGTGDDIYYSDNYDVIIENANEGMDTIYTNDNLVLVDNVENLVLLAGARTGDGNALNNSITGNAYDNQLSGGAGNDVLSGDYGLDLLHGNEGNDQLFGGYGDDQLYGDDGADLLDGGYGDDQLFGDAGDDKLNGSFGADILNGGAGKDTLNGDAGDDILNGGADADTLIASVGYDILKGGTGDDTYVLDNYTAQLVELAGEGTDTVQTSKDFDVSSTFIENVTLTGTANVNATGNSLSNSLVGNSGNNTLTGKEGNDTLTGGKGDDTYLFARGYGTDTIVENDATASNADRVLFSDVAANQLWFSHVGNNLEVSIIGTVTKLVISDWYSGSANHVEKLQILMGRTLVDTKVENLVTAMASLTPPAIGQLDLNVAQHTALDGVIAANWS